MRKLLTCMLLCFTGFAVAVENQMTICTRDNEQRVITLFYFNQTSLPCEVKYTKDGETQTLWSAHYEEGYCEEKARELIENQSSWGWDCVSDVRETP